MVAMYIHRRQNVELDPSCQSARALSPLLVACSETAVAVDDYHGSAEVDCALAGQAVEPVAAEWAGHLVWDSATHAVKLHHFQMQCLAY